MSSLYSKCEPLITSANARAVKSFHLRWTSPQSVKKSPFPLNKRSVSNCPVRPSSFVPFDRNPSFTDSALKVRSNVRYGSQAIKAILLGKVYGARRWKMTFSLPIVGCRTNIGLLQALRQKLIKLRIALMTTASQAKFGSWSTGTDILSSSIDNRGTLLWVTSITDDFSSCCQLGNGGSYLP